MKKLVGFAILFLVAWSVVLVPIQASGEPMTTCNAGFSIQNSSKYQVYVRVYPENIWITPHCELSPGASHKFTKADLLGFQWGQDIAPMKANIKFFTAWESQSGVPDEVAEIPPKSCVYKITNDQAGKLIATPQ